MNNSEENTIGKRVREMRKRKGLNQQELADILGKSLRTVQKIRKRRNQYFSRNGKYHCKSFGNFVIVFAGL